jgi:hypothetical protein
MDYAAALGELLDRDPVRSRIVAMVSSLRLPDCWIGAGFLRNAVWDHLHGRVVSAPVEDIDVIWFDPAHADAATDAALERGLRGLDPLIDWSVKNQGRMHVRNGDAPYTSCGDAMRHWPETATAVAVRQSKGPGYQFAAPFGLDDLFGLVIRPTPGFQGAKRSIVTSRVAAKGWLHTWPLLRAVGM